MCSAQNIYQYDDVLPVVTTGVAPVYISMVYGVCYKVKYNTGLMIILIFPWHIPPSVVRRITVFL